MLQTFRNAWRIEELRKKILFTLLIVLLYRLGNAVPVPFVDTKALAEYFQSSGLQNTILGLFNVMSGGAFSQATIFALSIQPYINASIIIQLLCIAIPALERLQKEGGEEGKKKIASITRYSTVAIGLLQGFAYYMMMRNYGLMNADFAGNIWAAIVIILTFTSGSALIMWLGEQITEFGIGNGMSIILFVSIVARFPNSIIRQINNVANGDLAWWVLVLMYLGALLLIVMIVLVNDAERRLPVQYSKRVVGRKMYGGQSTHLPMKVNMSGVLPIIFAQSIASLPATICAFVPKWQSSWIMKHVFDTTTWPYIVLYFLLIIFFSYFYSTIQFNPIEVANNIRNNGGSIPGIRPGKLAARLLEQGKSPAQVSRILGDTYYVSPSRRRLAVETAQAGLRAKADLRPEDISLYIGIPFCPTRCAYCSFVSQSVEKSLGLMEPYLDVLCREITDAAQMVRETGLRIKSFYMGGGTPTTLSAQQMDRLLTHLNRSFDLSGCVEYCIEAGRPDTITREKLQVLLDHGADRISVNPQSLEDTVLQAIGRRHTARDIEDTMALAASMGFPHVNMDLIAGLPADTPEGFRRTLDKCLTFGADNITVHTLSLKKGSRILLEGLPIPTAEDVARMLDYADPTLRAAGFSPYYLYRQKYMSGSFENVGWCISGAEGLYNIYIMEELHSILSLGAGGSTKMVDPVRGRIERVFHAKYPTEYIQRPEKIAENLSAFRAFHENMKK